MRLCSSCSLAGTWPPPDDTAGGGVLVTDGPVVEVTELITGDDVPGCARRISELAGTAQPETSLSAKRAQAARRKTTT